MLLFSAFVTSVCGVSEEAWPPGNDSKLEQSKGRARARRSWVRRNGAGELPQK